jgi:hypothetical protein
MERVEITIMVDSTMSLFCPNLALSGCQAQDANNVCVYNFPTQCQVLFSNIIFFNELEMEAMWISPTIFDELFDR